MPLEIERGYSDQQGEDEAEEHHYRDHSWSHGLGVMVRTGEQHESVNEGEEAQESQHHGKVGIEAVPGVAESVAQGVLFFVVQVVGVVDGRRQSLQDQGGRE